MGSEGKLDLKGRTRSHLEGVPNLRRNRVRDGGTPGKVAPSPQTSPPYPVFSGRPTLTLETTQSLLREGPLGEGTTSTRRSTGTCSKSRGWGGVGDEGCHRGQRKTTSADSDRLSENPRLKKVNKSPTREFAVSRVLLQRSTQKRTTKERELDCLFLFREGGVGGTHPVAHHVT